MSSIDLKGLNIEALNVGYNGISVITDLTLTVPAGTVFALLGPNGAGKSTLLKAISGQVKVSSGRIRMAGRDLVGRPSDHIARTSVCTIPEGRGIFPSLTVSENLRLWGYSSSLSRVGVEDVVFGQFPRLRNRGNQLAGTLSGGEQQMLALSRALCGHPRLLLLDEMSMGLAPLIVRELYEVVAQLASSGTTVVIVEQFADAALSVANSAGVLVRGELVESGAVADVRDQLRDVYFQ